MASIREKERRLKEIWKSMEHEGIDALLVCGRGNFGDRGAMNYVSNLYMWGGTAYVILPLKGEMILFQPGFMGMHWAETSSWAKDNRSVLDQAKSIGETLADLGFSKGTIGVVGLNTIIPVKDLNVIESLLPQANLKDATNLLDQIRMIKSEEEIAYFREMSTIMKKAFKAAEEAMAPGKTEREVVSEGERILSLFGCRDGFANIACSNHPTMRPATDYVLQKEDIVVFDWEFVSQHGYGLELSSVYSFITPPDNLKRIFEVQKETYQRCLEVMKAGNSTSMIRDAIKKTYEKYGYSLPPRSGYGPVQYDAHGIGLDLAEPPYIPEQDIILKEGMVFSLHPHIGPEDNTIPSIDILDNVLVTTTGGERLTFSEDIWKQL